MKRASSFLFIVIISCASLAQGQTKAGSNQSKPSAPSSQPAATKQTAAPQTAKPEEKKEADCGCEAKVPADAAAIVNGVKLNMKDIDDPIKTQVQEVQSKVVEARK